MDYTVIWSPEAIEDVDAIAMYITRDSVFYAGAVVAKILAVSRSIPEQPLIGRIVPEIGDENVRERFIYSYRLVYKIQQNKITIAAVIHGKRLLDNIAERFE